LAENFSKAYIEMGGSIVTQQAYSAGDVDVAAQLGTIKTSGAQAVYLPGYYTDVGNIVRQARKQGVTVPFLGGDGWDSAKLTEIGGDAIEGSYFSNHYSFEEDRPEVKSFVAKYKAKFGEVPDGLAALGYDAANVMFDAMERAPSLSGADLAAAINSTKDYPGVTGKITLDERRDAVKKAVVLVIKNGKPAYVTSVVPKGWVEPAAVPAATPATVPAPAGSAAPAPAGSAASGSAAAPAATK
jgi:branched-chain amino acid transport system substrate-binding protein